VPQELIERLSHEDILTYEEILRIVNVGIHLGITKVRVTGGEKGVYDFLTELTQIPGLSDVSLTTNGVFLKDNIEKIRSARISRINISLDTLSREKYQKITGRDTFDLVWHGIEMAQSMGFDPIKLNIVALNGVHIRFIEYMPIGQSSMGNGPLLLVPEIKKRISVLGNLVPVRNSKNDGPAKRYQFEGAEGEIGFIPALSDHQEEVKGPLRSGCSDEEIAQIFLKAVNHKPSDHNLAGHNVIRVCGEMRAIGG
jgi:cyclic pyranopterin phosphate synthase